MSLGARSSILIALGTGVLLAPAALLLSPAAIVTGLFVGVIAIGIGIAGTATRGRGTISVVAHQAYDRGLAAGLAIVTLAFALAGDAPAALIFGAVAVAQTLVSTNTRYSEAPA
jgi:hypothetical protein